MWWSPTNERESALANDVQLLRNWFVEREVFRGHHPIAFGVGSIWSPQERALSPFVLLNRRAFRYLPVPPAPASPFFEIFHYAGGGNYLSLLAFPETQLRTYAMAVTRPRPTNAMISLSPQILKERLLAEFVQVREPISCMHSGNQGSAGVAVWDEANEEPALLTAGHIFPDGVGSRVDKVHWRLKRFPRFFPKVVHLGTITHHVAPNGPIAAWDAAVIRLAGRDRRARCHPSCEDQKAER